MSHKNKYLLIILLFITSLCNAQISRLDSILKVFIDSGVVSAHSGSGTLLTLKSGSFSIEEERNNDTVSCILLVCNTDEMAGKYMSTVDNPKDHITIEAYYMKGYWYHPRYSESIWVAYLDENKKPLPENIIVWMSKSLNKK